MIYQFIYGRKNEGYCQINSIDAMPIHGMPFHGMPFQKNDLLKLENLKSYNFSADIDKHNLPEALYFYNDDTALGRVGILGKTSHVPGRTSIESGDRDTSFLHKYIFIEEDYQKILNDPKELCRERKYYNNIDEYNDEKEIINEKDTINEEGFQTESNENLDSFLEDMSISKEMLEKFIFCCLEVFPKYDKRIYCYLPSNDKLGSDKALKLMKLIMMTLPPCIISGVGYLTYSPTFHNAISNPIPGNISVVFIPRNEENLNGSKNEQEYNYIFDFKNNISPQVKMTQMGAAMINNIVKCIFRQNLLAVEDIYNELNKAVTKDKPVDSGFLGAFYLYYLFNNMYKLNKSNCSKFKNTIVTALMDLSRYQERITGYGNQLIINVINTLLNCIDLDADGLNLIDLIYEYSKLCKDIVIQSLSDKCLEIVNENRDDRLFVIIDYPFQNREITAVLMQRIYSSKEYYVAAYKIVARSLYSFTNIKLDTDKKIVKVFEAVTSLYRQYEGLAKTEEFMTILYDAFNIILSEDKGAITVNAERLRICIDNFIEQYLDCSAYERISEEICYKVMRDRIEFDMETRDELEIFYRWCHQLFNKNDRLVRRVFDKMEDIKFYEALLSHEPNEITILLKKYASNQAVIEKMCQKYLSKICDMIENLSDDYDINTYFPMFQSLMYSYDSDIYKEIMLKIMKKDNISGVREFYYSTKNKLSMNGEIKRMISECLQYILECESYSRKLSADDNYFIEELGISDAINNNKLRGKSGKESKVKKFLGRNKF